MSTLLSLTLEHHNIHFDENGSIQNSGGVFCGIMQSMYVHETTADEDS